MESPSRILSRYGLSPKKSFSQNFIVSPQAVEAIVRACNLEDAEDAPVVELGAGLGTLTGELVKSGARVYAVERDRELVAVLQAEFARSDAIEVVEDNAATVDFTRFISIRNPRVRVVGNLPYAITGAIIKHLCVCRNSLLHAVLTVQREVRDRLQANPGSPEYGALTVFTQANFRVQTVKHLPPTAFFPRPKIRSSIVKLIPIHPPRATENPTFRNLVHAAFQARRKTLRNALLQGREIDVERIDSALSRARIDGKRRGETLSIEEFDRLSNEWQNLFLHENGSSG